MKQRSMSHLENLIRRCTIALCAAALMTAGGALNASAASRQQSPTGVKVFGWGFSHPSAVASDGSHVWVANTDSVTELNAASGHLVRVISGLAYPYARHFFNPVIAIAARGAHVWVLNGGACMTICSKGTNSSITELDAATGNLVRVISGPKYRLNYSAAISVAGGELWVANGLGTKGGSVTEVSASTGDLVRVISGPAFQFSGPDAISSDGVHVWVADGSGASITELEGSTGKLVRVISRAALAFPVAVASDGAHVWLATAVSPDGWALMELNASTGNPIRTISDSGFESNNVPGGLSLQRGRLWVANEASGSVLEVDATTGASDQDDLRSPLWVQGTRRHIGEWRPRLGRQL